MQHHHFNHKVRLWIMEMWEIKSSVFPHLSRRGLHLDIWCQSEDFETCSFHILFFVKPQIDKTLAYCPIFKTQRNFPQAHTAGGLRETWKRFCLVLLPCMGDLSTVSGGNRVMYRLLSSICQGNKNSNEEKTYSCKKNLTKWVNILIWKITL